jgi:hypothetical protein
MRLGLARLDRSNEIGHFDRIYFLAGRGTGKTHIGIAYAFVAGMTLCQGRQIAVTYPRFEDARVVGSQKIHEILPDGSYTWNKGELTATLTHTGTKITLHSRNTAQSYTSTKGRGGTNALVIHDEPATDRNAEAVKNFNATIRGAGAIGAIYIGTPKMGWLWEEVSRFRLADCSWGTHYGSMDVRDPVTGLGKTVNAAAIYARTIENPYGGEELHLSMLSELDERIAAQELDAQWVAISGRLWDNWIWKPWPTGNVHHHTLDPGQTWYLSCDFGSAKSSWIAWQRVREGNLLVHVAVAEWQIDNAGVKECLSQISTDMGRPPAAVYAGHDLNTRAVVSTEYTPAYFIAQQWGHIPMIPLDEVGMDKRVRYERMRALTCAADRNRRIAVSRDLHSYDPGGRGIKRLIEQDAWPDSEQKRRSPDYMPKDGQLEHCRDAVHHYVTAVEPPRFYRDRRWAA